MIIGISGKKRSGKDTVANMISDFIGDTKFIAFAGPIKDCMLFALNSPHAVNLTKSKHTFTMDDLNGIGYDREQEFDGEYTPKELGYVLMTALQYADIMNKFDVNSCTKMIELCEKYSVEKMSIRKMMQTIGTDIVVAVEKNYWVDSAINRIDNKCHNIFTDIRQIHEMSAMRNICDEIVFVERINTITTDTHITEIGLTPTDTDVIIDNNSTLEQLENNVKLFLRGATMGSDAT